MNTTAIVKKGEALLVMIYKRIADKFTNIFKKILDRFPLILQYPLLKFSLIPLLIALFVILRYVLRFIIDELAVWASNYLGETTSYSIPERTIIISIAVMFIGIRVIVMLIKRNNNEMEVSNGEKE